MKEDCTDFRDVEQNLIASRSLLTQYDELQAGGSSQSPAAIREAEEELRETIALLEADLEDLDESVRVVESTGDRWGLGDDEISRRRRFVEQVKREVGVGVQSTCALSARDCGTDIKTLRDKALGRRGDRKGKGKQRTSYRDEPDI